MSVGYKCDNCYNRFDSIFESSTVKMVGSGDTYQVCKTCYGELQKSQYRHLGKADFIKSVDSISETIAKVLNPFHWWTTLLTGDPTIDPPKGKRPPAGRWPSIETQTFYKPEIKKEELEEKPKRKIQIDKL